MRSAIRRLLIAAPVCWFSPQNQTGESPGHGSAPSPRNYKINVITFLQFNIILTYNIEFCELKVIILLQFNIILTYDLEIGGCAEKCDVALVGITLCIKI